MDQAAFREACKGKVDDAVLDLVFSSIPPDHGDVQFYLASAHVKPEHLTVVVHSDPVSAEIFFGSAPSYVKTADGDGVLTVSRVSSHDRLPRHTTNDLYTSTTKYVLKTDHSVCTRIDFIDDDNNTLATWVGKLYPPINRSFSGTGKWKRESLGKLDSLSEPDTKAN